MILSKTVLISGLTRRSVVLVVVFSPGTRILYAIRFICFRGVFNILFPTTLIEIHTNSRITRRIRPNSFDFDICFASRRTRTSRFGLSTRPTFSARLYLIDLITDEVYLRLTPTFFFVFCLTLINRLFAATEHGRWIVESIYDLFISNNCIRSIEFFGILCNRWVFALTVMSEWSS